MSRQKRSAWLIKMPGGVGSGMTGGGAGVRGSSARGLSRVTTARDRDLEIERKEIPSGRLDMPTKEQLEQAMADGYCWWCGRTKAKGGKPFKSWGKHWGGHGGHGFDLQQIRDILQVSKRHPLCTPELSTKLARISRNRYESNPDLWKARLRPVGNPRKLSKYGIRSQRKKLAEMTRRGVGPGNLEALEMAHEVNRRKNAWKHEPRPCSNCGTLFDPAIHGYLKGKSTRVTCSDTCWHELRLRRMARINRKKRKPLLCVVCGKEFWTPGKRRTCSKSCLSRRRLEIGNKLWEWRKANQ